MTKMIFINLPVVDLPKAMAFYHAIGFSNNPHFTDETAACMVWSDTVNVMLLTHKKWQTFTQRPIPPTSSSEVMLAIPFDSRQDVDKITATASSHGGTADINPAHELGFMYSRAIADPDGHVWEIMWMDPKAFSQKS